MINNILIETKKYIDADEYYAKMQAVASFYQLSDDEFGMLFGRTNALLLGTIKESEYVPELMSELEIPEEKAKNIESRIKTEIIQPFRKHLINALTSTPDVATDVKPSTAPSVETLRQQVPVPPPAQPLASQPVASEPTPIVPPPTEVPRPAHGPLSEHAEQARVQAQTQVAAQPTIVTKQMPPQRPAEHLTKEHILSQIENPPRTVIKKYVIEHEPIKDPSHLIDDTIDTRPRIGS